MTNDHRTEISVAEQTRIETSSLSALTTERIRRMIHTGAIVPGQRILLEELSSQFGVSKTPLRDALNVLRGEGLIEIVPRVGVYVREISEEEIKEVYEAKGALEPLAARRAAQRGTASQREQFGASMQDLLHAAQADDVPRYVQLLELRRERLMEMAGSDVLRDLFAVIDGRVRLMRYRNLSQPGHLASSVQQHQRVADAVVAGDPDEAFAAMRDHMRDAYQRVLSLIESSETPEAGSTRTVPPTVPTGGDR